MKLAGAPLLPPVPMPPTWRRHAWSRASNGFVSMTVRSWSRRVGALARAGGLRSVPPSALVAAAVVALFINLNEDKSNRLVPGSAPTTQVPTPSTAVATTNLPDTTVASNTTPPTTPFPSDAIGVRHDALPPAFPAKAFLGMTDQTQVPFVAIGDTRIVTGRAGTRTATTVRLRSRRASRQSRVADSTSLRLATSRPVPEMCSTPLCRRDGIFRMSLDLSHSPCRAIEPGRSSHRHRSTRPRSLRLRLGVLGHGADGIIDRRTGRAVARIRRRDRCASLSRPPSPRRRRPTSGDVTSRRS